MASPNPAPASVVEPLLNASDDESTGESIPFEDGKSKDELEGDNDNADDEGVYTVEEILDHDWSSDGELLLLVKWKGYENPEDQTWEPEENLLEGAEEVLAEYFKAQGGRPKPSAKQAGRKRKSTATKSATVKTEVKKRKKSKGPTEEVVETPVEDDEENWMPKKASWEGFVTRVDTIVRDPETDTLYAYLYWKNGKRSKVMAELCYKKCPLHMLRFYEDHLVFKDN